MQIFLSPQVSEKNIKYTFHKDVIVAEYDGEKDTFDFSGFPDGVLDPATVATVLDINPVLSAKRENGILYVELLNFISGDATEEERFPEWFDPAERGAEDGGNEMEKPGGN